MLMLTVILLVIVADRIEAACWMPARKLAGAAIAAASNMRLMVKPPLPDVTATTEPAPPEPFWAAWAWIDSSGMVGVGVGKFTGDGLASEPAPLRPAAR